MISATFSPRALRELRSAARWIERDNPPAAQALLDAALRAAGRIGAYPRIGVVRPDFTSSSNHRFVVLTGFQYWIVYVADRDPPLIVRVVHASRDLPRLLGNLR